MNTLDLQPNHRILVIDDNPSIHTDFRDILCPGNSGNAAAKGALRKLDATGLCEQTHLHAER